MEVKTRKAENFYSYTDLHKEMRPAAAAGPHEGELAGSRLKERMRMQCSSQRYEVCKDVKKSTAVFRFLTPCTLVDYQLIQL
jgi:hypothetical protein